ncbi:MAG: hypothetical protein R3282_10880, partial [Rhodothermales bacterium]|nr:hypothetical protein [Rhodothermales bacterium]
MVGSLGQASIGAFWLPVVAWSAVILAALALKPRLAGLHPQVMHLILVALHVALPAGIVAGLLTSISLAPVTEPILSAIAVSDLHVSPDATTEPPVGTATLHLLVGLVTAFVLVLGLCRLVYFLALTTRMHKAVLRS